MTCHSCGHVAESSEMIPELTPSWCHTGYYICGDAGACYARWLAIHPPIQSEARS